MRSDFLKLPRDVYILSLSQVIGMSGATMIILIGGLIGTEISPSKTLATLPVTLMIIGAALATIPAAILMKKIGRKKGFILSAVISVLAALLATFAITQNNFYFFCLSTLLLGTQGAFLQQYRFAALESVPNQLGSKAVSLVLLAGVLAGFLGPEIAKRTKDLFSLPSYAGSFIVLAIIFSIAIVLLSILKDNTRKEEKVKGKERPLLTIMTQPIFLIAVLSGAIAFGVMSFIMTATPIHLHKMSHFSLNDTVFVIQSHIVAMFLPSLITGTLIGRFGAFKILLAGLLSFLATVFFATIAHSLINYWMALVFLGIGWNFLYISSTVLLPKSYTHSERFKIQGVNDFIIVISQTFVSFYAGSLLFSAGWTNLNLVTLPFIIISFAVFVWYRKAVAVSSKKVH